MSSMPPRRCPRCGETKERTAFSPAKSCCKPCHAASEASRRAAKKIAKQNSGRACAACHRAIDDRGPQAIFCKPCRSDRKLLSPEERERGPSRPDALSVLPLIAGGLSVEEAANKVGISPTTIWRKRLADEHFADKLASAIAEGRPARLSPHGTIAAYRRGCRCDGCREASVTSTRDWRQKIRSRDGDAGVPHGTIGGRLNYQCKCEQCQDTHRRTVQAWQAKTNTALRAAARRHGNQWTGPELELASREDLSSRQVGEMIGRTLWAVATMRRRLTKEPKQILVAGVARSRRPT